jgi:hypothetical protein
VDAPLPQDVPVHPDVEAFVISDADERVALRGQARCAFACAEGLRVKTGLR